MQQTPPDVIDQEPPSTPAQADDGLEVDDNRRWQLIRRLALLATIVPIYVAVVRDGLTGWYPTLDAATVITRSRDVFSTHPPLVGMWASVSTQLGTATYFPGAIQLYLLAGPVHLLGNRWGTLVTMGTINAVCVLAAGWLATRRLGPRLATVAYLAMAMLVWTMGSEVLVDAAPMQMVTIPFALFLFAVWSVADGDVVALPVLAVIANFLILDHLIFTLMVPAIGMCAVTGLAISLWERRKEQEGWPAHRSRTIRMAGLALGATVVLWIPSLVQQFRNSPGNLTNLWYARTLTSHRNTPKQAADAVVSILAKPPFWLGDSFRYPSFGTNAIGTSSVVLGIALAIGFAAVVVFALRKRDRTSLSLLAVALVSVAANSYNITRAPSPFGFRVQYLHSLWVMAMFVWLAVAITLVRNVSLLATRDAARRIGYFGVAATLLTSALTIPHRAPSTDTNGTADWSVAIAKEVRAPTVAALRGKGQILLLPWGSFYTYSIWSSLILALETADIDVCVQPEHVDQYGPKRACKPGGPDLTVTIRTAVFPPSPNEKVIAVATTLTATEQAEFKALSPRVAAWLATQDELVVTPAVHAEIAATIGEDNARTIEQTVLDTAGRPTQVLALSQAFADFVGTRSIKGPDGKVVAAVETGTFPAADLVRWAELARMADNQRSIRIAILTLPPGS